MTFAAGVKRDSVFAMSRRLGELLSGYTELTDYNTFDQHTLYLDSSLNLARAGLVRRTPLPYGPGHCGLLTIYSVSYPEDGAIICMYIHAAQYPSVTSTIIHPSLVS